MDDPRGMKLVVMLLFSLLPFLWAGLLVWMGPRNSWSARYRQAIESREAKADEAEQLGEKLVAADQRLRRAQRRLAQ